MRQIEDYQFNDGQLEVWTYDDQTEEDCVCSLIPLETVQDAYESIYGNDYLGWSFNETETDIVEYSLCSANDRIFFITDAMCGMNSKDAEEIINIAFRKIGIPAEMPILSKTKTKSNESQR